jgi:metal-responsive CopG/Arc/MetJ family transcriptional regulator
MKIEIEMSEKLLLQIEDVSKKLKISRKKLIAKAPKQFVEKHKYDPEEITAKLNEFFSKTDISFDSN